MLFEPVRIMSWAFERNGSMHKHVARIKLHNIILVIANQPPRRSGRSLSQVRRRIIEVGEMEMETLATRKRG
jgi:hypothetical protein